MCNIGYMAIEWLCPKKIPIFLAVVDKNDYLCMNLQKT